MFFRNTKKRLAKQSIKAISQLKLILYSLLAPEYLLYMSIRERKPRKECEVISKRYTAYTINKLFGDDNEKTVQGNNKLFEELDHYYGDTVGIVINRKFPELKPLITDGLLKYYQAREVLGSLNDLGHKQKIFDQARSWDLIEREYKPYVDDREFMQAIAKVKNKYFTG